MKNISSFFKSLPHYQVLDNSQFEEKQRLTACKKQSPIKALQNAKDLQTNVDKFPCLCLTIFHDWSKIEYTEYKIAYTIVQIIPIILVILFMLPLAQTTQPGMVCYTNFWRFEV